MRVATGPSLDLARDLLRRQGLRLVWIGLVWNVFEAGVALWSGVDANSVALIAFGLDSFVELFAGSVLILHLSKEWKGEETAQADRKAHRLLGYTFFLLSLFILIQASATLLGLLPRPQESPIGIALVIASAVVMSVLYLRKRRIAAELNSPALRAEAVETLVCDLQDLTVLVGLGLNAIAGLWWADPLAALLLIPFLLKEGIEPFRAPSP